MAGVRFASHKQVSFRCFQHFAAQFLCFAAAIFHLGDGVLGESKLLACHIRQTSVYRTENGRAAKDLGLRTPCVAR